MRLKNLVPLNKKTKRKYERFAVADIESRNWVDFLVIGFYNGRNFQHFSSIKSFFEHLASSDERLVLCHFGGIFDFLFLMQTAIDNGYPIAQIIPRGSAIFQFTVTVNGRNIVFSDSSALLSFSLHRLTHSFDVEHKKLDLKHEDTKRITKKLLTYLEHDCKGLYEVLEKFWTSPVLKGAPRALSLASQSLSVYRSYLKEKIPALDSTSDRFIRRGYFGGRVEIFKPVHKKGMLYHYDVNSLYPYVMKDAEPPTTVDHYTSKFSKDDIGFCEAEIFVPKMHAPPLPYFQNKLIFPTGKIQGVYSSVELNYAESLGCIIKRKRGYVMRAQGPIFKDFILDLYETRQNAKNEVDNLTAKLFMNSLYGRMGLRLDRENIEIDGLQVGSKSLIGSKLNLVKVPVKLNSFSNVAIAAWITSLARIHLHRLIHSLGASIYYCDTDSVFTTTQLPVSNELGGLKLEGTYQRAAFILPKTYATRSNEAVKTAMKGFPKEAQKAFGPEELEAFLLGELRVIQAKMPAKMLRFATAAKTGYLTRLGKESTRSLISKYDKRIIFRNQSELETRPIEV